jgi:predicted DNA-binding protein (UPF0251 family)
MPQYGLFRPAGVPCSSLEEIILSVDEMEAIRLADLEGMHHEQAAGQMNISRQTFGRVIESARRKVAQALCQGQALRIEGGTVEVVTMRKFQCSECQHGWELPHGTGRPQECPKCASNNIHRAVEGRGCAGGPGWGGRRGRCHRHGVGGVMRRGGVVVKNQAGTAGEGKAE